jgi:hypothetical protein
MKENTAHRSPLPSTEAETIEDFGGAVPAARAKDKSECW